ncbi:hypothetical protein [Streptomyces sp. NPDC059009]|uniref:hypothetical protein n=1 Tax=Streptomyces sp. NPDC059009 TaxID=3346694 RepID=UPI00369682A0
MAVTLTVPVSASSAPAPATQRVSVAADGAQANGDSTEPSMSADGHLVAFQSTASNLVPGDTNGRSDVFVKNLKTGAIVRVDARGAGAPADADALQPSLSADGRYVAFTSEWTYPVPGGPSGRQSDVYVRDLRTGRTTKVNVGLDQGFGVVSRDPAISADGRRVAFVGGDTPWFPAGLHGNVRVYLRDVRAGSTERVSAPPAPRDREAYEPRIDASGNAVAYRTTVPKVSGPPETFVYAWRRAGGQAVRVDTTYDGSSSDPNRASLGGISPDGAYVLFDSSSDRMVPGALHGGGYLQDLRTGERELIDAADDPAADTSGVAFTDGGRRYLYGTEQGLFERDRRTGASRLLSSDQGDIRERVFDARARTTAYGSWDDDRVPSDTNGRGDVFVTRLR